MAAPSKNNSRRNQSNDRNGGGGSNNGFWLFATSSALLAVGAYYYYNNSHRRPATTQHNDDDDDILPLYNPTPLGDYDDTDDGNMATTALTAGGGSEDGQKRSVRQEYIGSLLRQHRFSSVLRNPHLHHDKAEFYFHLGFDSASPLLQRFSRIKWVIFVRSVADVKLVARRILHEFPQFREEKNGHQLPEPMTTSDRYYMLQIASIVIVSCGLGASSVSILLQEITKVLVDAGAFAPTEENSSLNYQTSYVEYVMLLSAPGIATSPSKKVAQRRKSLSNIFDSDTPSNTPLKRSRSGSTTPRGTSSSATTSARFDLSSLKADLKADRQQSSDLFGACASQGTRGHDDAEDDEKRPSQMTNGEVPVIIPTSCFSEQLSAFRPTIACGKLVCERKMKFDRNLIYDIKIRCSFLRSLKPRQAKGLCVQYFHEALSHNSVAIAQDANVKSKFIQNCIDRDIKYVDMESGYFAAFCNTLSVSCVAIVGVEYDIAAPSRNNDSMRVTHESALQATLDVFCQYLWDRIKKKQDSRLKRQQSQPQMDNESEDEEQQRRNNCKHNNNNEKEKGHDEDLIHIPAALDRSSSWSDLPRKGKANHNKGRNKRNIEDAAAPAAFSGHPYPTPQDDQHVHHHEGI